MAKHISEQFDVELESTNRIFLEMGGLVEGQLRDAFAAYIQSNLELATQVVEREASVNRFEVDLNGRIANVIARRQPAAGDLRLLVVFLKNTTDLERIGDESKRIARLTISQPSYSELPVVHDDLTALGDIVTSHLGRALNCFVRRDSDAAQNLINADKRVDNLYKTILDNSSQGMTSDSESVDEFLTVIWIARALERIGDHAKNLAENVIYLVTGEFVTHTRN